MLHEDENVCRVNSTAIPATIAPTLGMITPTNAAASSYGHSLNKRPALALSDSANASRRGSMHTAYQEMLNKDWSPSPSPPTPILPRLVRPSLDTLLNPIENPDPGQQFVNSNHAVASPRHVLPCSYNNSDDNKENVSPDVRPTKAQTKINFSGKDLSQIVHAVNDIEPFLKELKEKRGQGGKVWRSVVDKLKENGFEREVNPETIHQKAVGLALYHKDPLDKDRRVTPIGKSLRNTDKITIASGLDRLTHQYDTAKTMKTESKEKRRLDEKKRQYDREMGEAIRAASTSTFERKRRHTPIPDDSTPRQTPSRSTSTSEQSSPVNFWQALSRRSQRGLTTPNYFQVELIWSSQLTLPRYLFISSPGEALGWSVLLYRAGKMFISSSSFSTSHLPTKQNTANYLVSRFSSGLGRARRSEEFRDYTTFDTPLSIMRLTVLPQGWTGSVGIFHNDAAFMRKAFRNARIPGPKTRYENSDGTYETIPENSGIRSFIWEHAVDLNCMPHRLVQAGATVSAKKLQMCQPEIIVVGRKCAYEGQEPECDDGREGVDGGDEAGVCLGRRAEVSDGGDERRVSTCEALRPIDHSFPFDVILSVDALVIAVGFILAQLDGEGRRRPARFGSIPWNERIVRYSQSKLELYGLFQALNATQLWIIGSKKLVVEVDAQYIKGMLNKPDLHPNAAMNRWICVILMFDFELVHVPGRMHKGPDGLSRRRIADDEGEGAEGAEEAEDWMAAGTRSGGDEDVISERKGEGDELEGFDGYMEVWVEDEVTKKREAEVKEIRRFLETMKLPEGLMIRPRSYSFGTLASSSCEVANCGDANIEDGISKLSKRAPNAP
ncbi:hypothetical protein NP233_g70 [Leucocoprinus birnbaumii]|uniref:Reverse transcriptase RNase H-like domain-containing protein n=1 Tax=Leucocoprinus birnbaumii TaxID=56174 RepID=A0AAD5W491_9AGAR|nr:hypothetical protein NP233_g70 [Leucocoprinus birnbaumii]